MKYEENTLRVWWIPQVGQGNDTFNKIVNNLDEGKLLLTTLGDYDLFQLEHKIKQDYSNAGGLEIYKHGSWEEYEDENGNDIDEIMNNENVNDEEEK